MRIELSALLALPCQTWHGYGVSCAHHGEVRGCRRACERTPLRGRSRCAAGGRHMVYRYEKNMENTMSLSPRCAARSRRSRALVIRASKHVLVESGMPYLGSCAIPAVPELEGKAGGKTHLGRQRPRPDRAGPCLIVPRLSFSLLGSSSTPISVIRRQANAIPWRCFPTVNH